MERRHELARLPGHPSRAAAPAVLAALASVAWGASPASAQPSEAARRRSSVRVELPIASASPAGAAYVGVAPTVSGRFLAGDAVELELVVPVTIASYDEGDGGGQSASSVRLANPFAGIAWRADHGARTTRLGGGIVLPVASFPDRGGAAVTTQTVSDVLAFHGGQAMGGLWDYWLFVPDRASLVLSAGATSLGTPVEWSVEGAVGLVVATSDAGPVEPEVVTRLAGELAGRHREVAFGVRLQAVANLSIADGDAAQLSLEPFLRVDLGDRVFFRLGVLVCLDAPLGDDGELGRWWALRPSLGVKF